jgi:lysophospholipase
METQNKSVENYFTPTIREDWWESHAQHGMFNRQGIKIATCSFQTTRKHAKANVFLVTGANESFLSYADIIYALVSDGFNVMTYDHQGQGLSERWLAHAKWVYNWDDYVDDLSFYITTVTRENPSLPVYAIAHSLGGLILAVCMSRHPTLINRCVLLCPMFRTRFYISIFRHMLPVPEPIVYWVSSCLSIMGLGAFPAFGFDLTTDIRADNELQMKFTKALYEKYPGLYSGAATNDWRRLCILAQKKFSRRYKFVRTNCLVLCAASDAYAHTSAMLDFAKNAASCKLVMGPCYHNILFETDDIKDAAQNTIFEFLNQKADDVSLTKAKDPFFAVNVSLQTLSVSEKVVRAIGVVFSAAGALIGLSLMIGGSGRRYR